ncbi:MAG: OmpH family outer membrane protein [Cytophagales bacterium]|nr:MAG: OmpH family outer membrane protein [Cytophagales bacterium]
MKKIIFSLLLSTAVAFTSFQSNAQTQKIGYTNLDYILGLLPDAKKVESELKTYEEQLQKQLQSKYSEYEKKLKEYQDGVSKGIMTDLIKEDKEKELMSMQTSIKEFEESAKSSMQKKQVALLEPVLAKVQKAIDEVGKENDYSYILSTHADYGGSAIILYAKSKEDNISDLVLKKLGVTPPPATENKGAINPAPKADAPKPMAPVKSK